MNNRYSQQTKEAVKNGYEYHWKLDDTLTQEDINMISEFCDRVREDDHDGSCWDLLKVFDQLAHEYCKSVKSGKPLDGKGRE